MLVVTAVAAERDSAARGLARWAGPGRAEPPQQVPLPGGLTLHRVTTRAPTPGAAGDDQGSAGRRLDLLAAGVGPAAAAVGTATALTAAALRAEPYGLVVSAGIAGGVLPVAPVGSVVVADAIVAADLGAEGPTGFLSVRELGFGVCVHRPPHDLVTRVARALGAVSGAVLTVSTATGTARTARARAERHPDAVAEAMEGFGVAEAAAGHGVPALEVRAVSNPVGPRDRDAWRIGTALDALAEAFAALPPHLGVTVTHAPAPPPSPVESG
ncbi:futalosine hydrolase [Wenjunlia vitaminophila]|uniref:futalosine hydrolase n=1 Tax=Wenjunlia vitaminophila TaxID=76728 RepID=UPI0003654EDE